MTVAVQPARVTPAAVALYRRLVGMGVRLEESGGRLRVEAPPGALTDEDRDAIRRHKPALLELIRIGDAPEVQHQPDRPGDEQAGADRRGMAWTCHACGYADWWRLDGGPWTCAICHPPAVTPDERVTRPVPPPPRPARAVDHGSLPAGATAGDGRVPRCKRCGSEVAHWSTTICARCRMLG